MAEEMLLGIDVGTTAVKAILFDAGGAELDCYRASYPTTRRSNGVVEQDPELWIHHILRALEQFTAGRDLGNLKAIGITSQVDTHVFVDTDGNSLAPAIVWQDGRCAREAAELDVLVSDEDRTSWWGSPRRIDASHCLSRMRWMARHHPEIWGKTKHVMLPKDFCIYRLTGEFVSDPISNFGLVDTNLDYIPKLLDLVPGARDRLAPLARITDLAGRVRPDLPCAGVPLCVSTMDAWAGMFGVGVHDDRQAMYLSGTSEVLAIVSPDIHPVPGVLVFPDYDAMKVHIGPTQSGGASITWYCDLFNVTPAEMAARVEALDRDAPCPLFLPHLQGERAPIWDIHARGTFLGIDARMGASEIARAVYEGVGFSARLLLDSLQRSSQTEVHTINCGGGGFQSDIWNQIRADILGRSLKRTKVSDPGVLGASAMAAVAANLFGTLEDALAQIVKFDRTFEPDAARHRRYNDLFKLYEETYLATRHINAELGRIYAN